MDALIGQLENVEPDNILKSAEEFRNDKSDVKVNLSIGVCCDENGQLHIFKSVLEAEKLVQQRYKEKPYMLSNGTKQFSLLTQKLIFGENSKYLKEKKICTVQAIGGTGAICIALQLFKMLHIREICVTNKPYVNHVNMITSNGIKVKYISFFEEKLVNINYDAFLNDLRKLEDGSVLLLQVSCYNPCSTNIEEIYFDEIANIVWKKKHVIVFDIAYQGFGSSNMNDDVSLVKKFEERGISFVVCQSFSKNMSLYGERAGALHIVCKSKEERKIVANNLRVITRKFYSSPTIHTNRIVCQLLEDEKLKSEWISDLRELSERVHKNRVLFFEKMEFYQKKFDLHYDWSVYKKQRGIFSFVPMFSAIYRKLKEHHVYIIDNGRINVSGITARNVDYVAEKVCLSLAEVKRCG
ncbi:aspartate aminotransferase, putative [Plasmodium vivax]|uniref:Aspartate aminotransferase n=6 Tax=Plasmodium vivax TaxID=5855 RepID=A5KBJ3_PLAVS|nr:aspartate aminotransferase, mitochondrial precursor, putative [Plasmodium vivax]KMZ82083.1 aspartate aminotransferase [Plasmodium vivax India VII]KMZ88278.1 aspartate aminotransferase [Plasmodium vivax Brazil I]KMZ94844.1 aspartate aminotransferase [Plasmodium vivax Mauritania I]KNA01309.1 aspartate aminotransferase [Plasmodium vivax North Korean]EDL43243.1 aspartate aminotransferase, mitochondrial precursor, putative [Plasmodium vivax]|eukprot:XP_001612970.1 aspartate aminotransferase, mitochondrial precursor [Plasmodium vivax Sal-1]